MIRGAAPGVRLARGLGPRPAGAPGRQLGRRTVPWATAGSGGEDPDAEAWALLTKKEPAIVDGGVVEIKKSPDASNSRDESAVSSPS